MNALKQEQRLIDVIGKGQYAEDRYPYPWLNMPASGEQFNYVGSIACPPDDGLDYEVAAFLCPPGYEGVLWAVAWGYEGTGYIEGSGSVLWRCSVNRRYPRGFDQVPLQLGRTNLWQLPAPVRFRANERLLIEVSVPAGSPVATGAGNYVFGTLSGYIWPSRR